MILIDNRFRKDFVQHHMRKNNKNMEVKKKIIFIDMDNVLVDFKSGIKRLDEQARMVYEESTENN